MSMFTNILPFIRRMWNPSLVTNFAQIQTKTVLIEEDRKHFPSFSHAPLHHRGSGHPEGDEREGGGHWWRKRHHDVSLAQQPSGKRRRPHHPAAAGHHLHPRTCQAYCQPLLTSDYCLPGQVKRTLTVVQITKTLFHTITHTDIHTLASLDTHLVLKH